MKTAVARLVMACGIVALAPGCLSFRTGGLPEARLVPADGAGPTARVEVSCQRTNSNTDDRGTVVFPVGLFGGSPAAATRKVRGAVAGVLGESRLFRAHRFAGDKGGEADLRLAFDFRCDHDEPKNLNYFSLVTLTVIPATATLSYRLTVRAYDREGRRLGSAEVSDAMRIWHQLLFLPLGAWKAPDKTEQRLVENLVRTALAQMQADGLLRAP